MTKRLIDGVTISLGEPQGNFLIVKATIHPTSMVWGLKALVDVTVPADSGYLLGPSRVVIVDGKPMTLAEAEERGYVLKVRYENGA